MKEEFINLLQAHPPKDTWSALLPQVLLWSFRRFCVCMISMEDASESFAGTTWEDHIELITEFAPPPLKPYLDDWLQPEHMSHVENLTALDHFLRRFVTALEKAIEEEDGETQDALASLLDDEMSSILETWLGPTHAHFSLFPTQEEDDDTIDTTKLNAILYLLRRQQQRHGTKKTLRVPRSVRFVQQPVQQQMRKTRKIKQQKTSPHENIPVPEHTTPHGDDTRGGDGENHGGDSKERPRNENSQNTEERPSEEQHTEPEQGGDSEHTDG